MPQKQQQSSKEMKRFKIVFPILVLLCAASLSLVQPNNPLPQQMILTLAGWLSPSDYRDKDDT